MNKVEFIKLAESLELPITEYCILSGGSLLLHNIRETNDLDIDITEKGFKLLSNKFSPVLVNKEKRLYKVTDEIECFIVKELDKDIDMIEGYPCQSLETVYKFKKMLNRPKDLKDVEALEKLLNIKK